jgi:hypothetical protein
MITIYNGSGSVYQTILPNETDITYFDLIKYIKITKHPEFDEIDFNKKISYKIFIKTSIVLFDYFHHNEIKLDDEINENELLVMFKDKYYLYKYPNHNYEELINDIQNYDNIFDAIESNPYKLIFIDPQIENYEEICKFAVQKDGHVLRYVKEQTDEICKLAVQQNGNALHWIKEQTEEICKLAIKQNCFSLQYIKNQTEEICKFAVQQNVNALKYVVAQTEEICKLAVQQNGYALKYVVAQTEEICKLAVQKNGLALLYVKNQTDEICKLAIKENCYALEHIRDIVMQEKILYSL